MLKNVPSEGTEFSFRRDNKWCVHLPVFYALINGMFIIPAHVTGWGLHPCTWKDSPMKITCVVFICQYNICFVTFFLLYFNGIEKFELKIIPTNLQFIWRCSHLAKLWVDASLTTPSLDNRERYTFEQSLPVVE